MKAHCLPFQQVPHTSAIFSDYLCWTPKVREFYSRSPRFLEWFKEEASRVRYSDDRRLRVASALERYNKAQGASERTLENVARLRSGALVAVTGQQVGLFGGPAFSIYKALTAVKLAAEATKAGVDTVPVFWLATQDHDLEEIRHTSLPAAEGALQKLETTTQGIEDAPVGTITFGPEIDAVVESAVAALGASPVSELLRQCYRPGETFGSAFAHLFARLFAEQGVILLDATDPELNQIAAPMYRSAIDQSAQLEQALIARGQELESAGYHQQVKVTPNSTLMFWVRDGARTPIHRSDDGQFIVGKHKVSQAELLQRISEAPHEFNANVLLRPSVQDYLLPTLVYTGGSAEVAYFAQNAVVYEKLHGRVTPIVPRFSATIVEPRLQNLLERYRFSITDVFQSPETLREELARRALPQELQSAFDQANAGLQKSFESVQQALAKLDKTLVDAANTASEKIRYQFEQLRARAARAELRQTEVIGRHAQLLSNALYPNKVLQERELPGIYFLARCGDALLRDLYDNIQLECVDHQVLNL